MDRSRARAVKGAMAGFVYTGNPRARQKHLKVIQQLAPTISLDELILASIDELFELLQRAKHIDKNLAKMLEEKPSLFKKASLTALGEPKQLSQPITADLDLLGSESTSSVVEGSAPNSEVLAKALAKGSSGKSERSGAKGASPAPKASARRKK